MRTSFHHQPEAQHPKSSAIHKLPADYPIFGSKGDLAALTGNVRFTSAGSTDRRNTGVKSLCWGLKLQRLPWPFVELTGGLIQLRVHRQVGSFRKVLPQQTIGVLIGAALPRTLRITEVDVDVGRERKSSMIRKLLPPVPGQGLIQ